VRIALAGFVIPFMAVYNPALMLQGDNLWATAYMLIKTLLAVGLWGMASTGFLQQKMLIWERVLSLGAGALLIVALPVTDEIGFALGILVIVQHVWRSRRAAAANA
jgi:TRAP-type uncharacterized transport system fused permease subunit